LSLQEALETTKIHSVAGKLPKDASLIYSRPFRSPHHTISDVVYFFDEVKKKHIFTL
jgi:magnesium chelatase family protein